jgi:hypothetical protein
MLRLRTQPTDDPSEEGEYVLFSASMVLGGSRVESGAPAVTVGSLRAYRRADG